MGCLNLRTWAALPLVCLLAGCWSYPPPQGAWHTLRPGETVWRVAKNYGTSVKRIVRSNDIDDVTEVQAGTRLWVPGGTAPTGVGSGTPAAIRSVWRQNGPDREQALKDARKNGKLDFRWPVKGRLTSHFGRRWGRNHEGLDVAAKTGTPVYAAESGRVIHSARLGAYGKALILRHSKDYTTVYAHNSKLLVKKGDWVEKGDRISLVGSTGRSTGPHLHFEVRRGKAPQDPLHYLP